jgi:hypothetical protein
LRVEGVARRLLQGGNFLLDVEGITHYTALRSLLGTGVLHWVAVRTTNAYSLDENYPYDFFKE